MPPLTGSGPDHVPRNLAPDEQALWELVTRTIRPLAGRSQSLPEPGRKDAHPPLPSPLRPMPLQAAPRSSFGPRKIAATPVAATPARLATATESLDASWDRRLTSGKARPDRTIDLHGLNLEAARHLLHQQVGLAAARGERVLLVITGKGHMPGPAPADLMPGLAIPGSSKRGAIRASLPRWLAEHGLTGRIAAVRRAHPRHGGEGAAYLILKR